ncbi:MAG: hypothetical protein COA37_06435 [Hoeflea sp.]|uniref:hypothetical protein n=1 Tax=Hoeflea sp. TaxID=1940281 RepID=UPI000C0F7432|nr:hypothetical protein [Hoeflea sp.]PHR24366.1 MAG: hypothetical protein COA37_06435 [Hoeflea sp.]
MSERSFEAHLDMLKSDVLNCNLINASIFRRKIEANLTNALAMIEPSETVMLQRRVLTSSLHEFADIASDMLCKKEALEAKKTEAVQEIEAFSAECHKCPPSGMARALGID